MRRKARRHADYTRFDVGISNRRPSGCDQDGTMVEISDAAAFEGKGEQLKNEYTQRLWRALPQNDFDLEFQGNGGT